MPDKEPNAPGIPARRETIVTIRLDPDLHSAAVKKLAPYGVGVVLRALLRAYVRGDVGLTADDIQREMVPAPRRSRKPRKSAK
jgi:hypothetical protein